MRKMGLRFIGIFGTLFVTSAAFAQDVAASNANDVKMYKAIAAGLAIGIAAFGGALGQGRAAAAALEGVARNPNAADKLQTPLLLSLALIESLVIYALLISAGWVGPLGGE
ncbi:MAG: ATP synthase F0 subunit C [Myxococcota bacterium]